MISFRPFLNGDIPAIVDIWRNNSQNPGMASRISVDSFDQLVLSKPYFDREGLILALDETQPLGYVHAGFGPAADESQLDYRRGVVSMLLVKGSVEGTEVAEELLRRAEQYLRNHGAEEIFAGGVKSLCPFYLGLYGGSDLPGILDADTSRKQFFENNGYTEVDHALLFRRSLEGFRPTVDRAMLRIGRTSSVHFATDPPSRSWWDACNQDCFHRIRAELLPNAGGPATATAIFWDMESLVTPSNGARTTGISDIQVGANDLQGDTAKFLLLESLGHLHKQGFASVQGLAMQSDTATIDLLNSVGFEQYGGGAILRK